MPNTVAVAKIPVRVSLADEEAITAVARAQIRQEWLDAGVTEDELGRGERIAELFAYMVGAGLPDDEAHRLLSDVSEEPERMHSLKADEEPLDPVTRAAHAQIKQEWLDAGTTGEEWERSERAVVVLDYMLAAGVPDGEVARELENVSEERLLQLERRYLPKV